ncbi:short-chain dehydrogenase [Pseudoalteromonas ruthenica]|uniref:Short-chain dehydrogenase n=1 Tax=Pseudoalteromonas ruthenica TaxID=151081 RepID=A0A5S3Z445_9GAMM|nr:SDR family NAD(P)-dependent oxidoreductase [Pseudoalteromonas ruthenica]TMP87034.1 short-chain dehydrogenase [Pseudoalteromonas ruthenica]
MKVLITGATSGIGEALAKRYAQQHDVIACGRDEQKLKELEDSQGQGHIKGLSFDVTELEAIKSATTDIDELDLVVLNAGNCEYVDDARHFDSALFERVITINLLSLGYCLEALLPKLKSGAHLAIVSSSVTYLPLTRSEAYGASKSGATYLAKSLAVDLKDIDVSVIHPGFVKTPLTDNNDFPMPMAVSAEQAAEYMYKGLQKRRKEIHFPKRFTFILKLLRVLPWPLWRKIAKGMVR